jgi:hypothetical protein
MAFEAHLAPNTRGELRLIGQFDPFVERSRNDRYLRTAGDWNRRIVFSNTAAKPRI